MTPHRGDQQPPRCKASAPPKDSMISLLATLIQHALRLHRVDHRVGALYCEHGGREYVVLAIDITDRLDAVAKALDVARAVTRGKGEA